MTPAEQQRFNEIADTGRVTIGGGRDGKTLFTNQPLAPADAAAIKAARQRLTECEGILKAADAAAIKAARQRLTECEGILKAIGLHPDKIKESIRQMDEGKGIPMEDVVAESRREHPKEWAEADELASLRSRLAAAEQRVADLQKLNGGNHATERRRKRCGTSRRCRTAKRDSRAS